MKSKPFFTIVIPTYNRASFIKRTIQSVLDQSFQDFEIIVVDDGSTDNTEELVNSIKSDKVTYYKKANEERAIARNTGAQLSKGEYVNFFDSDDLLYPNHLEEANNVIQKYKFPEFLHLGYEIKDTEGNVITNINSLSGDINQKLIFGNFLGCNGVFLRRDIALKHPFNGDRDLSASEDYELWLRLAARYPIRYSNIVTSTLINHDSRSVLITNKDKLIKRKNSFVKYLWEDEAVREKYSNYKDLVLANSYTYIALHLALTKKHRISTLLYLFKSIKARPATLGTRRFWATLKNLIKLDY
ncbi:glycosyltransferase family 2 protein [Adhaeribacter radiodurans]|uniref:Glycosyltransferase n=1 Tax=Adhaeribacter radiodurans TaxID=2745197 RepID=A0A7L7L428_9BACT|nr:glycosyltransferase [Adhaeribacter radiodurans]QMU27571.1 glycosyltransferase [Adhaeribacter radiodurans]